MHQPTRGAKAPTVATLISHFLDSEAVSPASKEVYTRQLRPFFRFAWEDRRTGGRAWDRGTVDRYKAHLIGSGLALSTVSSYLVLVRKFFAWAERKGLYADIAKGVRGARLPGGIRHTTLSLEQARAVLNIPWAPNLHTQRDRAAVNLMLRAALSPAELARADVGDIRMKKGKRVLVLNAKDPAGFVVLRREVWTPLCGYLKQRHALSKPRAPLLTSVSDRNQGARLTARGVSNIAKGAFALAGLDAPYLSALSLRQTAIRMAIEAGATLQEAQALARHARAASTADYRARPEALAAAGAARLGRALGAVA